MRKFIMFITIVCILFLLTLELNWENINSKCFDLWTGWLFSIFLSVLQ